MQRPFRFANIHQLRSETQNPDLQQNPKILTYVRTRKKCVFVLFLPIFMHQSLVLEYKYSQNGGLTQHISTVHEVKEPFDASVSSTQVVFKKTELT